MHAGIYIHIPYCDTKCIYCDFYSLTDIRNKTLFISSLKKEIISVSEKLRNKSFDTIYFGGGTPSLLEYDDFAGIFEVIYRHHKITDNPEITIEINPGTLNKSKLQRFKKLPINRLSFGVQSFIDSELEYLTRIHSAKIAEDSVKLAQDEGYTNINIDLIFAIPGQSLENWKYNLNKAYELLPQHISAYSLIFEESTPLHRALNAGRTYKTDAELESDMYDYTADYLKKNGYKHYEISNFAKAGYLCRHNLKYWSLEEYIGYGPSASSYINSRRWTNIRNLKKYIEYIENNLSVIDFSEETDENRTKLEYIMLKLRSTGIDYDEFEKKFGSSFQSLYSEPIKTLIENNFAAEHDNKFFLNSRGYSLCDEITTKYF